jgi:hypothetical protein
MFKRWTQLYGTLWELAVVCNGVGIPRVVEFRTCYFATSTRVSIWTGDESAMADDQAISDLEHKLAEVWKRCTEKE